jgi:hypothetical protein
MENVEAAAGANSIAVLALSRIHRSLRVLFAPLYEPLKQNLVFAGRRRHGLWLGFKENRRKRFIPRLSRGETGKSRHDEREKRYTSETQSVHIGLFC